MNVLAALTGFYLLIVITSLTTDHDEMEKEIEEEMATTEEQEEDPSERREFWEKALDAHESNYTTPPPPTPHPFYSKSSEEVQKIIRIVAFFIRQFKFFGLDRRYEKSEGVFFRQFPEPALNTLDAEVEVQCAHGIGECLDHVHRNIKRYYHVNDSADTVCFELKNNTIENMHTFMFKVSSFYYLCWYTMKQEELLKTFNALCDDRGSCVKRPFVDDARTNADTDFACALHSFCPDFCCGSVYSVMDVEKNFSDVDEKCKISSLNPCYGQPGTTKVASCSVKPEINNYLPALMENKINYTCQCIHSNTEWAPGYMECVDKNECEDESVECPENQTCLNLMSNSICICQWGFLPIRNGSEPLKCEKIFDDLGNLPDNTDKADGEEGEEESDTSESPFKASPTARKWLWNLLTGSAPVTNSFLYQWLVLICIIITF